MNIFTRSKMIALLCLVAICASGHLIAKVTGITTTQINERLWVFHGGNGLGANAGVYIDNDYIVVIDAMNQQSGQRLINAIRKLSNKPIKYVINTHQHKDHRGGNEAFVKEGATIIYPNYLPYLIGEYTEYAGAERELQFNDRYQLNTATEQFDLYHVKSHTWNDVIVKLDNSNVIFTGDNHATNWGPSIGVLGLWSHRSIIGLLNELGDDNTAIVPGHVDITDISHVRTYRKKVDEWLTHVTALNDEGKTAKEISEHPKSIALLTWFHGGKYPDWLPTERLIPRINWAIKVKQASYPTLTTQQQQNYIGDYRFADDSLLKIFSDGTHLYAFHKDDFMSLMIPKDNHQFTFLGWGETEGLSFKMTKQNKPLEVTFSEDDKKPLIAQRLK